MKNITFVKSVIKRNYDSKNDSKNDLIIFRKIRWKKLTL